MAGATAAGKWVGVWNVRALTCTLAVCCQVVVPCSLCAKTDHVSRDCQAEACFKCGNGGHRARVTSCGGCGPLRTQWRCVCLPPRLPRWVGLYVSGPLVFVLTVFCFDFSLAGVAAALLSILSHMSVAVRAVELQRPLR